MYKLLYVLYVYVAKKKYRFIPMEYPAKRRRLMKLEISTNSCLAQDKEIKKSACTI